MSCAAHPAGWQYVVHSACDSNTHQEPQPGWLAAAPLSEQQPLLSLTTLPVPSCDHTTMLRPPSSMGVGLTVTQARNSRRAPAASANSSSCRQVRGSSSCCATFCSHSCCRLGAPLEGPETALTGGVGGYSPCAHAPSSCIADRLGEVGLNDVWQSGIYLQTCQQCQAGASKCDAGNAGA